MNWIKDDDTSTQLNVDSVITQAQINISSTPSGASIIVNGTNFGVTPLSQLWDFGTYVVNLSLDGYEPLEQTVTVVSEDPITINPVLSELPPEKVILTVSSTPVGAEVYVNGNYEGTTNIPISLDAGTYEVVLRMPDFPDHIVNVTLTPGKPESIFKAFVQEAGINWVVGLGLLGTAYHILKGKGD